jgi:glutathione S-transferase
MELLTANKNYSSWSMRPWILLKQLEIPFEDRKLSFNDPAFKAKVLAVSPTGRVPALVDGDVTVWDSLAIVEYLAEKYPDRGIWPRDPKARARARAICAEMHAGFSAMRDKMAMNCELRLPNVIFDLSVRADVARVIASWSDCRAHFGVDGPFLFGAFSAADAYYAPVVRRFLSYGIKLSGEIERYVATIDSLPAMRAWMAEALAENDYVRFEEPYRDASSR